MYDAKKTDEKKEKVQKYNCIMDRAYFNKSNNSILNLRSSQIPKENTFF